MTQNTNAYGCSNCDNPILTQKTTQWERVTVDENEEPVTFTTTHMEIESVTCENCGEELMSNEE